MYQRFDKLFFNDDYTIAYALNGKYSSLTVSLLNYTNRNWLHQRRAAANGEVFPLPPVAT